MNHKYASLLTHVIYLLLLTLSIWSVMQPFTFSFGITISSAKLFLFAIIGWYGIRKGLFAGIITYGIAFVAGQAELIHVLVHVSEIFLVGFARERFRNLLMADAMYWLLFGVPVLIAHHYFTYDNLNSYIISQIQTEVLSGFFSVFLADLILTYLPFRQRMSAGVFKRRGYEFNKLMIHLALTVMILPLFLYGFLSVHSEEQNMKRQLQNQFNTEVRNIERVMNSLSDTQMQALKLGSVLQEKLLLNEIKNAMERTGTDVVILDEDNRWFVSTFPLPESSITYDWQKGGEVAHLQNTLHLWLPDGDDALSLNRWESAYVVNETKMIYENNETFTIVMMTPYSPYLIGLIEQAQSVLWVILFITMSMVILSLIYNVVFFKPLARLADTTTSIPLKLAEGIKIQWSDSPMKEISELAGNFRVVSEQLDNMFVQAKSTNMRLQEQKQRLEESERQLHMMAYYDLLTGLPNRLSFKEFTEKQFNKHTAGAEGNGTLPLRAVFFIDIDHFKQINDTFGHDAGDMFLKQFAHRLVQGSNVKNCAFRISGDEFVLIMDIRHASEAMASAELLLHSLSQPIQVGDIIAETYCSIGIALFPEHGETIDELLKCADTAMYKAKQNGRNQYMLFHHEA